MILANTLFQCVCYHPEEFQIITSGTDRKVSTVSKSQDISGTTEKRSTVAESAGSRNKPYQYKEGGFAVDPPCGFGNAT